MTVVVISNRVVSPKPDAPIEGGLAGALLPAVRDAGAIWVGASGRLNDGTKEALVEIQPLGEGAVAMVDMPAAHYERYYSANLMTAAVLGAEPLDELEALARQYFALVENREREDPFGEVGASAEHWTEFTSSSLEGRLSGRCRVIR